MNKFIIGKDKNAYQGTYRGAWSCIFKQFPDEGVYRISRVEEWLATNGYTLEKLGFSDFHELIEAAPELFGTRGTTRIHTSS